MAEDVETEGLNVEITPNSDKTKRYGSTWIDMRRDYEDNGLTMTEIKKKYGVSGYSLFKHKKEECWKSHQIVTWQDNARKCLWGYIESITGLKEAGELMDEDVKDMQQLQEKARLMLALQIHGPLTNFTQTIAKWSASEDPGLQSIAAQMYKNLSLKDMVAPPVQPTTAIQVNNRGGSSSINGEGGEDEQKRAVFPA